MPRNGPRSERCSFEEQSTRSCSAERMVDSMELKAASQDEYCSTRSCSAKGISLSAGELPPPLKFTLRNTFIQIDSAETEDVSPRACSDSRSENEASSSSWFEDDRAYLSKFEERMNTIWVEKALSDSHGDSWSDSASHTSLLRTCSNTASVQEETCTSSAVSSVSEVATKPLFGSGLRDKANLKGKEKKMSKEGLRYRLKAAEKSLTYSERVSTALAAIDELPEQLEDVLKQTVNCVYDDVQGEIDAIAQNVVNNETSSAAAGQAVESLEVIPDMVLNSFQASFAKATNSVRRRVQVVIQDVEEGELRTDQIVTQLRTIPEDVQTLTEQAVEEAVQEVKMQAHKQLDVALQALPVSNTTTTHTLSDKTWKLVASVPNMLPDTVTVAKECMAVSVEQAVADFEGEAIPKGPKGTGNQVVSDALLRAKADDLQADATPNELETLRLGVIGADNQEPVSDSAQSTNPGSVGHPELCPRPCLYFTLGQCKNGSMCEFCHLPHPKRPAHLDKRHRSMLKNLPFKQCVSLVMVVLREKLTRLQFDQKVDELLDLLDSRSDGRGAAVHFAPRPAKERSMLHSALRALSIRSLLTTLHRMAQPEGCQEQRIIDELLRSLRLQCNDYQLCDTGSPSHG